MSTMKGPGNDVNATDQNSFDTGAQRKPTNVNISSKIRAALILAALFIGLLHVKTYTQSLQLQAIEDSPARILNLQDFNWSAITPSEELEWTRCYGKFQCARLSVPLDYSKPTGEKAAIAMTKYPSRYSLGHKSYRGPVLFNPGGPGGSGIQLLLFLADAFSTILGPEYDLIGFDPRGVGFTTPGLFPFMSKPESVVLTVNNLKSLNSSESALGELYGYSQILGSIFKERAGDIAQHVTTSIVAKDMLSIVKAHGREKLQYWGFSYGTVLGATFAAMFPDNVERLIIDGVEDAEDYYSALWSNNLRDTDAVLTSIYQACVDAGPLACRIYEDSVSKIAARVNAILEKLKTEPVAFFNEETGLYGEVTYSITKLSIFIVLYNPYTMSETLVDALVELEEGNAEPLWQIAAYRAFNMQDLACDCPVIPSVPFASDGLAPIACSDGDAVNSTIDDIRALYEKIAEDSDFAEVWPIHLSCAGWKVRGVERFTGPFVANTSYPLLIIGNTADPVTPLWNAHKAAKGFNNSVVLTQESSGHCSIAASSVCTMQAVREYFREGKLPEPGTICRVESTMFGDSLSAIADSRVLSDEDRELLGAADMLTKRYFVPMHHPFL